MKKFTVLWISVLALVAACSSTDSDKDTSNALDTAAGDQVALDTAEDQDTAGALDTLPGLDTTAGQDTLPMDTVSYPDTTEAEALCTALETDGMNFGSCGGSPNNSGPHVDMDWFLCMGCYTLRGALNLCVSMPDSCPGGSGTTVYFPGCEAEYLLCINQIDPTAYDLTGGTQQIGTCQTASFTCKGIL
jgi:hypothetical protein